MSHPNSVHFSESLLLDEFSSMQDFRLFGLCLANHLLFNLMSFLDSLLLSGFSIFFCLNSSTLFVFHLKLSFLSFYHHLLSICDPKSLFGGDQGFLLLSMSYGNLLSHKSFVNNRDNFLCC
jgi:hypothetical protein